MCIKQTSLNTTFYICLFFVLKLMKLYVSYFLLKKKKMLNSFIVFHFQHPLPFSKRIKCLYISWSPALITRRFSWKKYFWKPWREAGSDIGFYLSPALYKTLLSHFLLSAFSLFLSPRFLVLLNLLSHFLHPFVSLLHTLSSNHLFSLFPHRLNVSPSLFTAISRLSSLATIPNVLSTFCLILSP